MINLNPKQKRFCKEYVIDHNGTQAAICADYSNGIVYYIASKYAAYLALGRQFGTNLATLKRNGLITTNSGFVKAADELFA